MLAFLVTQAGATQAGATQAGATQAGATQAGATREPGLIDDPIGSTSLQYLTTSAGLTWTTSSDDLGSSAGCSYAAAPKESSALVLASGQRQGISSREACCEACWAEALCVSSLHTQDGEGSCLLQAAPGSGADVVNAAGALATGSWTRCERKRAGAPLTLTIPANVPGDLMTDLQVAGQIGDPLYEKNWLNSSIFQAHTWTYKTTFTPSASVSEHAQAAGGRVLLVFDGIKMGANISLDGVKLGTAADQFLRYEYDVTALVGKSGRHTLELAFDPAIHVDGRFTACTGGWDWAPYSHTFLDGAHTFSKGIWKDVYLASTPPVAAAIRYVVPQIHYLGDYPTARLVDGEHAGFSVSARVHLSAVAPVHGVLALSTSWGSNVGSPVLVPAGESNVTVQVQATAGQIKLWWPNGMGAQPLYNLTATFLPEGASVEEKRSLAEADTPKVSASRTVGFRYVALVTGNDTDASYVAHAAKSEGSSDHGMYLRVNGVVVWSRGANVIPMEELEGRLSARAHEAMVLAAKGARFNMLRVWGGGMFLPDAFYEACDKYGMLVYHDMQYAQSGHAPKATATQDAELRHAIRRLASHVSISIWDGCNECRVIMNTSTGVYASFVMTVVAQEDASRAVWPSCPAPGWTAGVRMLDATPNGHALATPSSGDTHETHGPYQHGSGFPAVNGHGGMHLFAPLMPIQVAVEPTGPSQPNVFASEFGAVTMSSFESMAPTLAPEHWGLHAGQPSDTCTGSFSNDCTGPNVMAERNYPCDSLVIVYFGPQADGYFNTTGEAVFKKQLYQCLLSQALHMKGDIETRRSKNELGILVWQFNEIWPTGGWGSIEYGTAVPGQVVGGRWKPLHYLYKRSVYADVMASCGVGGACYIKNDAAGLPFAGHVEVHSLEFATGKRAMLATEKLALAAGAGLSARFSVDLSATGFNETTHMLTAACFNGSSTTPLSFNEILMATPGALKLPAAHVTAAVAPAPAADGSVEVTLTADATALFVTLTTLAHGTFSDNAFAMGPGKTSVTFVPVVGADPKAEHKTLAASLRVEHLQPNQ